MTNVEGLWMLFALLFLLGASLAVFILQIGVFGWMRWASRELGSWSYRFRTGSAILGLALGTLSWIVAVVLVTPIGIVANLADLNPVMIGMLLGYTLPIIGGGYLLQARWINSVRAVTQ